jgi:IS30 family transposase
MAEHFTKEERFYIEKRLTIGESPKEIAKSLGRHKSSIYREINNNTDPTFGFYSGLRAETLSKERQRKAQRRKSIISAFTQNIQDIFSEQLDVRSNPKQIASILTTEHHTPISQQTIYRYLWNDRSNGGKKYQSLRRKGKRNKHVNKEAKVKITDKTSIELRPAKLHLLMFAGNWEIDTIFGLDQKSYLLTIVDMATMYTIIRYLPNKESATIENALEDIISKSNLPFHSITSDNGGEFAKHANISAKFNLQWYFCHPFCSGERGLNENTNGLIRDFFPKRTDFRLLSDDDIKRVQNILNNRPRERIGFVRPAHAMVNHLMAA